MVGVERDGASPPPDPARRLFESRPSRLLRRSAGQPVIEVLRVIRLREEEPALGEQSGILDREGGGNREGKRKRGPSPQQRERQRKREHEKQPPDRAQEFARTVMEEFARVE